MKVFVIGGAGFIGSHICREFVQNGHQVSVFGPPLQEGLLKDIKSQITRIEGDILDPTSLFKGLLDSKAEAIIHLAAFGAGQDGLAKAAQNSPKKALDVNITGFYNILETAKVLGIRKVIWSSSTTVFGPENRYSEKYLKEDAAVHPTTFYGSTKVMDECMARYYREQSEMEVCGVRLPLVYGPGRWYKGAGGALVDLFEQCHSSEERTIYGGEEQIDLMYVKDAAKVFYQLASTEYPLSEVYHVKSHTTSLSELVEVVQNLVPGSRVSFQAQPSPVIYPLIDTSKIQRELEYIPCFNVEQASRDYLIEIGGVHHD